MQCAIIEHKGDDNLYRENFSLRIKKAREDAGYTQQQVAELTEISRSNISKYETNALEPNLETMGILAQFYNVSIDWLLGVSLVYDNFNNKKNEEKKHIS